MNSISNHPLSLKVPRESGLTVIQTSHREHPHTNNVLATVTSSKKRLAQTKRQLASAVSSEDILRLELARMRSADVKNHNICALMFGAYDVFDLVSCSSDISLNTLTRGRSKNSLATLQHARTCNRGSCGSNLNLMKHQGPRDISTSNVTGSQRRSSGAHFLGSSRLLSSSLLSQDGSRRNNMKSNTKNLSSRTNATWDVIR